jgi:serine/threonine protein kinase
MDLSSLKYGIVMPMAQGDLRDIFYREGISSSNLRDNARQVGETLRALHEEGITHMNLQMKNVLRFGMEMVLSDFGNALFLKSIEGINAFGGTATKLCPSILPPEMFARIELANRDSFDQLMRYWKYVHGDANQLRSLTPHERQAISQFVQSRISSKLSKPDEQNEGHQQWKENISSLLDTIRFEDLPYALSNCPSFRQFCAIWERLCQNYELWETAVRPWVDEEAQCVYLLKTFENRPNHPSRDVSLLPYKLVPPSEKVDVWIFGIFIYELCSGGNPLHTGYRGDLRGVEAYSKLHGWDLSAAERSVREHVQDPLAQDLLCQILVPAKERLPTMDAVLKHPFFWPKSVEAERFLEKYEEMQLVRDNTVTVRKVTKAVKRMLDDSMEKYCKMAFATDQVAFPTCLVVLPYGLNIDESIGRPIAAANPRLISCAVRLGKCLLDINKATARLSFWLMMSGKMRGGDGDRFKNQMQEWLKRARYESCYSIAMEIVNGLGCGMHYVRICEEVLAFDGNISQAKSYMRDPIRAARRAIKKSSDELAHLYQSQAYLYLVDETTLIPHCLSRKDQVNSYPMELENNPRLLANVLLPFMNIVAMKALAKNHLDGLAILLGLPPSMGIPDSWRPSEPGLLHSANDCRSIEDFVILQKILRKDTLNAFVDDASISSKISQSYRSVASGFDNKSILSLSALGLCDVDLSPGDPVVASVPMTQLELLFRERDPDREFGKLRRITSGNSLSKTKRPGLWTNVDTVRLLKSMVEIAEVEEQLRELKVSLDKTNSAAAQYNKLLNRRESLKKSIPNNINFPLKQRPSLLDNSLDDLPPEQGDDYQGYSEEAKYSRSSFVEQPRDQQPQDERDAPPKQDPEPKLEIVTHRMPEPPPQPTQPAQQPEPAHIPHHSHRADPDPEGMKDEKKKKMRKSKRKFRPWFTAC